MSGIYIHGMEMPKMPESFKQGERVPYIDIRIFADGTATTSKEERPYFTQFTIIPIPPHGDLIDRDALPQNRVEWEDVLDAPAIIPAEAWE